MSNEQANIYDKVMARVLGIVNEELNGYPVVYEELKQEKNKTALMKDLEGIVAKAPERLIYVPCNEFKERIKTVMLNRVTLLMNESERSIRREVLNGSHNNR